MAEGFLPVSREDMLRLDWGRLDFIIVNGDAYVDHSSFGAALIGRVLESHGYRVGIISQPSMALEDYKVLGSPRLAFLVTSGNMDSMVSNYTAAKKPRSDDSYSEGGKGGKRPDRAVIVYCNKIRNAFPGAKIIIGGIEASLRRFAHYDYWADSVRRSILIDSGANLLIYGMAEKAVVEVADALDSGIAMKDLTFINGTCCITNSSEHIYDYISLPSFEEVKVDKKCFAETFLQQYQQNDAIRGKRLVQRHGNHYLVQNPPMEPLNSKEMDDIYALNFMREAHPMYKEGVPALAEVEFSLTSSRGCFGACNFCALSFHQGRIIQARSHKSLIDEAKKFIKSPNFKGYIHDVGGPTANFRRPACEKQLKKGACIDKQCLFPKPCKNLQVDHDEYIELLQKLGALPGVRKVFIRSGLRYDYILQEKNTRFMRQIVEHNTSGRLKVAPEHVSPGVLRLMGKPEIDSYEKFCDKFYEISKSLDMEQYVLPYFISSHPGCTMRDAVKLAEYMRDNGLRPQQVQDFYPTPSTVSTCMYYTNIDPLTMEKVYVPRSFEEKRLQRALMQYFKPQNRKAVIDALKKANREDLIGFGPKCLVRPLDGNNPGSFKGSKEVKKDKKGKVPTPRKKRR